MPFGMGVWELVIIGAVGVLLFGSSLPKVARDIGGVLPAFKRGMKDIETDINDLEDEVETV